MPITANDVVQPQGELDADLFPNDSSAGLTSRLDVYIGDGYARSIAAGITVAAEKDEAARAWTYHRAFNAVYQRLSSLPSSYSISDQGSVGYSSAQIQAFADLAAQWLEEFQHLVALVEDPTELGSGFIGTSSVPHNFSF